MKLADFDVRKHNFKLSNGLSVVIFERPGMPVHARTAFKAGSRYDAPGKEGQAHFLEHMVVAGTKKYPTKTDLATYIEAFGGVFGAQTPKEEILLNAAVGDPNDLEIAIDVLGQMLTDSLFIDIAVSNERQSVLGEIGEWEANPAKKIYDVRYRLFFQGSTAGRSGVGTVEGVNAVTKSDLQTFLAQTLTADRGLLIISGDVNVELAKTLAEGHLGQLSVGSAQSDSGEVAINRDKPILIEPKSNLQIQLCIGFRTCPLGHADAVALDVISTILGGGRAASLSRILRQERGLVYSVGALSYNFEAGGIWTVETSADKPKLQAVLDAICEEFERVYNGRITEQELSFAKSKTIKSTRMNMQTSQAWVSFHTQYNLHLGPDWDLATYLSNIEQVTMADLKRVGAAYFKPGSWYLGMVGDITQSDFKVNY